MAKRAELKAAATLDGSHFFNTLTRMKGSGKELSAAFAKHPFRFTGMSALHGMERAIHGIGKSAMASGSALVKMAAGAGSTLATLYKGMPGIGLAQSLLAGTWQGVGGSISGIVDELRTGTEEAMKFGSTLQATKAKTGQSFAAQMSGMGVVDFKGQGAMLESSGAFFPAIDAKVKRLRDDIKSFYIGIASGLAPQIDTLLGKWKIHDWSTYGSIFAEHMKTAAAYVIATFQNPKQMFALFGAEAKLAFAKLGNFAANTMGKLWADMGGIATIGQTLAASLIWAFGKGREAWDQLFRIEAVSDMQAKALQMTMSVMGTPVSDKEAKRMIADEKGPGFKNPSFENIRSAVGEMGGGNPALGYKAKDVFGVAGLEKKAEAEREKSRAPLAAARAWMSPTPVTPDKPTPWWQQGFGSLVSKDPQIRGATMAGGLDHRQAMLSEGMAGGGRLSTFGKGDGPTGSLLSHSELRKIRDLRVAKGERGAQFDKDGKMTAPAITDIASGDHMRARNYQKEQERIKSGQGNELETARATMLNTAATAEILGETFGKPKGTKKK